MFIRELMLECAVLAALVPRGGESGRSAWDMMGGCCWAVFEDEDEDEDAAAGAWEKAWSCDELPTMGKYACVLAMGVEMDRGVCGCEVKGRLTLVSPSSTLGEVSVI